jgi:Cof subfamily protein (haloacid dehalogenase superfamily)
MKHNLLPKRAIITDLDGTLLSSDNHFSHKDLKTLKLLGENGVIRVIATGRSLYSLKKEIGKDFPIDYLIFAAGAGIMAYKTGELLFQDSIPAEETQQIASELSRLRIDFQVRNLIPNDHEYYFQRFFDYNPDFDRLAHINKNFIRQLKKIEQLSGASRIITISPNLDFVEHISSQFTEYEVIRASSPLDNASVWMEIYPKGVNKGSAVKYLCNYLNIDLKNTVGLGNDYNDIDFLRITGKKFFVSNAPKAIKNMFPNTVSNNQSALSAVVENVFHDIFHLNQSHL